MAEVPAEDIPGFSKSAVAGHGGKLTSIELRAATCIVLGARTQYYEGKGARSGLSPHGSRRRGQGLHPHQRLRLRTRQKRPAQVAPSSSTPDHINLTAYLSAQGATFVGPHGPLLVPPARDCPWSIRACQRRV